MDQVIHLGMDTSKHILQLQGVALDDLVKHIAVLIHGVARHFGVRLWNLKLTAKVRRLREFPCPAPFRRNYPGPPSALRFRRTRSEGSS
jgi:hypothetical protein